MKNAVNWFEIPAKNFERAKAFYETVLGSPIVDAPMPEGKYGILNYDEKSGVGGAICEVEGSQPSGNGTVVYLNGGDDLAENIGRVEKAGGKIVMPKTAIGENGFIALITDTEGNKVGFHSMG